MTPPETTPRRYRSFSFYILIVMVVLIVCTVGILTVNSYIYTKNNFDRESHNLEVQTERNLAEAYRLTDAATTIVDNSLNDEMCDGLRSVKAEYERYHGDLPAMDLETIKNQLGEGYDIYIIDDQGVIVKTTYPAELGQDFKEVPYFYAYLNKIRLSDGFFPDRVVHELLGTGKYRKYAYMPTSDHRYVLELGLEGPAFDEVNKMLDDHKNVRSIALANPYVESFTAFNLFGLRVDNNTPPDESVNASIREVIRTRGSLAIVNASQSRTTHFLFIDMKNNQYGSDPSRVVMITYNTQLIQDQLNRLLLYHILVALLAIANGCVLAYFLSRRITQPIEEIVSDVDIIARGNLEHRIGQTNNSEFAILEQSINTMVDSLKAAFQKMKDDEIFQKEMIDQLPVSIFIKRVDDGKYVFWNRTSEQLFNIAAADVIGRTDADLFPEEMVAIMRKENLELFLNRSEVRNKIISNKHLGGRIIHMIIVPIFDSQGTPQYVLGISEDVSQQNINLKMDLLFSITRHDILDNLAVIMSHLERAQLLNTREEFQQFFDKTIGSIESIRSQIAYMRALQELGIITPKWQTLGHAFDDAISLLPENSAEIRSDVDGLEIYADPLLPRLFYNILENSLRHTPRENLEITLSSRQDNDGIVLVYTDNGTGIPDDEKEKIFEVGNETGSFRGLFLIRELLGFTGITIQETGNYGQGVRFEIRVPPGKFRFSRKNGEKS